MFLVFVVISFLQNICKAFLRFDKPDKTKVGDNSPDDKGHGYECPVWKLAIQKYLAGFFNYQSQRIQLKRPSEAFRHSRNRVEYGSHKEKHLDYYAYQILYVADIYTQGGDEQAQSACKEKQRRKCQRKQQHGPAEFAEHKTDSKEQENKPH